MGASFFLPVRYRCYTRASMSGRSATTTLSREVGASAACMIVICTCMNSGVFSTFPSFFPSPFAYFRHVKCDVTLDPMGECGVARCVQLSPQRILVTVRSTFFAWAIAV